MNVILALTVGEGYWFVCASASDALVCVCYVDRLNEVRSFDPSPLRILPKTRRNGRLSSENSLAIRRHFRFIIAIRIETNR